MVKALVATKLMASTQGQKSKLSHQKGKCINCGIKGHWVKDCRKHEKSKEKPPEEA